MRQDPAAAASAGAPFRVKAVAGLLALLAGAIGAHRLYLGSRFWWIYPVVMCGIGLSCAFPLFLWVREGVLNPAGAAGQEPNPTAA